MAKRKLQSLSEEVKDALLAVMRDAKASPTARAIAGRSLVQLMGTGYEPGASKQPLTEMTLRELDEEIAAYEQESH